MVIYENIGNNMVKAYSNAGFLIHGGSPEADYEEAIDPVDAGRTYVETDRRPDGEDITDAEALAIITGTDEGAEYVGAEGGEEA